MPHPSFRFVHATSLCLDEPLVGTGPLSSADRILAEEATLLAWNGIVQTCLTTQVDFLLLTGNSFDSRNQSLRARVALQKGTEQLSTAQIPVYVVAGDRDSASAWRRLVTLPSNVTLLSDEEHPPVSVRREGREIASIFVVASSESDEARWSASGPTVLDTTRSAFRIGVVPAGTPIRWDQGIPQPLDGPGRSHAAATLVRSAMDHNVDYLALGEGTPRTIELASGLAHDPGSPQGLSAHASGLRGCSVIDVSPSGIRADRVAVAPIRWEELTIDVDRHTNWDDLVERMALMVMEREPDNDEQLWIIHWKLSGEGQVFDSLAEANRSGELWELLEAELESEHEVRRLHRLERRTNRVSVDEQAHPAGLLSGFDEVLQESPDRLVESVKREMLAQAWLAAPHMKIVHECLQQTPVRGLVRRARSAASEWLH